MKQFIVYFMIMSLYFTSAFSDINKKKILYINSYHNGYYWSDTIQKTILEVFNIKEKSGNLDFSNSKVELKIIAMDSKRNSDETYIKRIALETKNTIDAYKPDLIITSDDNAVKYVIVPYFYNHHIPVVFCGVNGDATVYGLPTKNITGMVEVELIKELITTITPYAKGNRLGYLDADNFTSEKSILYFEKILNQEVKTYFVKSKKEWKESYLLAQKEVDILILGLAGVVIQTEQDYKEIEKFVKKYAEVPSVGWDKMTKHFNTLTFEKQAEEQGFWAATKALEILNGKDISTIKVVTNKNASIYINVTLAKKLNIVLPFFLINDSILVDK